MSFQEAITCTNCQEKVPPDYVVCPYCGYSLVEILEEKILPPVKIRESLSRVVRILNPRRSLEVIKEVTINPDRKGAFLIVFLISGLFMQNFMVRVYRGNPNYEIGLTGLLLFPIILLFGGLILGIVGFLSWYLWSFITWAICRMLGGRGKFKETTAVIGYGLAPLVINFLVANVLLLFIGPTGDLTQPSVHSAFTQMLSILLLPGIIATIFLVSRGIQEVHRFQQALAFVTTATVAALYLFLFWVPNVLI